MPKRRAAENCQILPWLSAKADCKEKRFLQLGNSFLFSESVKGLSTGARWVYICMSMEAAGKRDFTFTHTAARKYGVPSSSYDRYLVELKNGGFIEKVDGEDLAQYAPGRYRFTLGWKGVSSKLAPQPGESAKPNLPQSGEGKV